MMPGKKTKAKWEPCCKCGKKSRHTKYGSDGKKYCNRHLIK